VCYITLGWRVLPGTNTVAFKIIIYSENEVL
jgi:hypothetical protein